MDYYKRDEDGNVVGIEKLVFMREDDFYKIMRAVNLASLMADQARNDDFIPIDLDGNPVEGEALEDGLKAIEDASFALSYARFIGDGLPTINAILFAH